MKLNILPIFLIAAVLALVTACDDDDDGANIEPVEVAYVSLYQSSPDAPDLDIIVDNRRITTYPFEYADYTGYLRFHTGDRNLKFGPYGASNIVTDTAVTFENNKAYSVFVVDNYADLGILVFDDTEASPSEGNARVRFVHLSPDAPEIDLVISGQTDPTFNDVSFKESDEFLELPGDEYDFEVTSANNEDVILVIPDIQLQAGWYYTIVVRGYVSPPNGNSNVLSAEVIVN